MVERLVAPVAVVLLACVVAVSTHWVIVKVMSRRADMRRNELRKRAQVMEANTTVPASSGTETQQTGDTLRVVSERQERKRKFRDVCSTAIAGLSGLGFLGTAAYQIWASTHGMEIEVGLYKLYCVLAAAMGYSWTSIFLDRTLGNNGR